MMSLVSYNNKVGMLYCNEAPFSSSSRQEGGGYGDSRMGAKST